MHAHIHKMHTCEHAHILGHKHMVALNIEVFFINVHMAVFVWSSDQFQGFSLSKFDLLGQTFYTLLTEKSH